MSWWLVVLEVLGLGRSRCLMVALGMSWWLTGVYHGMSRCLVVSQPILDGVPR